MQAPNKSDNGLKHEFQNYSVIQAIVLAGKCVVRACGTQCSHKTVRVRRDFHHPVLTVLSAVSVSQDLM